MNKELIERLARESFTYFGKTINGPLAVAICNRFLAAYLAERGKEALGYDAIFNAIAKSADTGGGDIVISVKAFKAAIGGEIFLATQPAIPEGMAMVPVEPAAPMVLAGGGWASLNTARAIYKAMLAAAGVTP